MPKDTTGNQKVERADIKEALMNLLNSSAEGGSQYVTFKIGKEEYGIPIRSVQEITGYKKLSELPNTPEDIVGIFNLRGSVIPIMDPRIKFGMGSTEYSKDSVIIIFKSNNKTVGMIVDEVRDVLTIDQGHVDETPALTTDLHTEFISGIGKVAEKFIIILNVDKVFGHDITIESKEEE